jgi:ribosomal protein L37AE/L43A
MNILQAMQDPKLFRKTFQPKKGLLSKKPGIDTWTAWRVFLSVLFGLGLDTSEAREIYRKHTGREDVPSGQFREAYLVCGRRSGKSIVASLIATFVATLRSYTEFLAPGEQGVVMVLAADRRQARVIFNYISSFLDSPLLKGLVLAKRKESIELSTGVKIEVHTSSYKSVRGVTLICAILDELSFWQDENSANPDIEVVRALLPSMATIPNALLLGVSSPYARRGQLYNAHKEHFGKQSDVLVWQADSLSMNPSLSAKVVEEAYRKDAASAGSEYGARFREDIENFLSVETVEAAVISGRRELPYDSSKIYTGFVDPSGGISDSFCMAIAHCERDKAVLDVLREVQAPLSPKQVAAEFATVFKSYHIGEIEGDAYGGTWPREEFQKWGVNYRPAGKTKNELYLELLAGLMSGQCELLDSPRLIAQLTSLERKTGRLHDVIDHPANSHDDAANCIAGALVQVLSQNITGQFGVLALLKDIAEGRRPMPKTADEVRVDGWAAKTQQLQKQKPKCPVCRKNETVQPMPVAGGWQCNQCGVSLDGEGKLTSETTKVVIGVNCCGDAKDAFRKEQKVYARVIGPEMQCIFCAKQSGHEARDPMPRGVTHAQRERGIGRYNGGNALRVNIGWKNTFGRFGSGG